MTTHGLSKSSEYRIWQGMKTRTTKSNHRSFHNYGGRGIVVCERWLNSFLAFYEDLGPRPSLEHSIERRDVNGNYTKDNCYWGTVDDQVNNMRKNIKVTFQGETLTLTQWSRKLKIKFATLRSRIRKENWTIEKTLLTPPARPLESLKAITFNGQTLSLKEWAKKINKSYKLLHRRLNHGWTEEDTLSLPSQVNQFSTGRSRKGKIFRRN